MACRLGISMKLDHMTIRVDNVRESRPFASSLRAHPQRKQRHALYCMEDILRAHRKYNFDGPPFCLELVNQQDSYQDAFLQAALQFRYAPPIFQSTFLSELCTDLASSEFINEKVLCSE